MAKGIITLENRLLVVQKEDPWGTFYLLPVAELDKYRLYPKALIACLQHLNVNHRPVYIGDVN
jgi:hypothetical protein